LKGRNLTRKVWFNTTGEKKVGGKSWEERKGERTVLVGDSLNPLFGGERQKRKGGGKGLTNPNSGMTKTNIKKNRKKVDNNERKL